MRRLEDFDVLILPGVGGAGPDHWQTFWQRAFPSFRRVLQDNWELPVYSDWALRLSDAVNAAKKP
ncbi:MAG: alpha/beta hydrolase, partial [Rhodocyclaceae bacterium]|nr:alpha/beta hydrolase [Rhodocyclaceae bacterium]